MCELTFESMEIMGVDGFERSPGNLPLCKKMDFVIKKGIILRASKL